MKIGREMSRFGSDLGPKTLISGLQTVIFGSRQGFCGYSMPKPGNPGNPEKNGKNRKNRSGTTFGGVRGGRILGLGAVFSILSTFHRFFAPKQALKTCFGVGFGMKTSKIDALRFENNFWKNLSRWRLLFR